MGKAVKISEPRPQLKKKKGSGCLTSILALLIFVVLLGAYVLHQCAMWQEVNYKLPVANNILDELQSALVVYNADADMNLYPVGELSFYEVTEAISQNFHNDFDPLLGNILTSFTYFSQDGITYEIKAQLDTGVEVIFTRTPDDLR